MKKLALLFTSLALALVALGASFPYVTLNNKTNRLSDNGTNFTRNGVAISGGNWVADGATNSTLAGAAIVGGSLVLRNGTNAQTAYLYRTYTDDTNYERLTLGFDSNSYGLIQTEKAGTGVSRGLEFNAVSGIFFKISGATKWEIDPGGVIIPGGDNTLDIGSTSFRPRSIYAGTSVQAPVIESTKAFQAYQGTLTHAGTVTLDFDGTTTVNSLTVTGALTLAFSNLATNRTYRLLMKNAQATNCALSLPAGVHGYYTTVLSNGWHMASFEAWGTVASNVWVSTSSDGTY